MFLNMGPGPPSAYAEFVFLLSDKSWNGLLVGNSEHRWSFGGGYRMNKSGVEMVVSYIGLWSMIKIDLIQSESKVEKLLTKSSLQLTLSFICP